MPMPMIIAKVMFEVNVQCLKSSSGMIGSFALDSASTNSAMSTTVATSNPIPVVESHPSVGPAQLR